MSWDVLSLAHELGCIVAITSIIVYVCAGEYAKDIKQAAGSQQGAMLHFVNRANVVQCCPTSRCEAAAFPKSSQSHSKSQPLFLSKSLSAGLGRSSTVHNKRSASDVISNVQLQPDAAKSNQFKLPRKGIGPMDRFLK